MKPRPCQPPWPNGPKPGWLKAWPAKNAVVPTPSATRRASRAARPRRRGGAGVPGFVTISVIDGSVGQWNSPDRYIRRQLFWRLLRRVKICKAVRRSRGSLYSPRKETPGDVTHAAIGNPIGNPIGNLGGARRADDGDWRTGANLSGPAGECDRFARRRHRHGHAGARLCRPV